MGKPAGKGEPLSIEQLSAVTQIAISVMNLSDMLQQDKEDSYVSEMMQTQQNSCDDENDLAINGNFPNKQEETEQTSLTEQKLTLTNVSNSLTVGFNVPHGATFTGSGEHLETPRSAPPSAQCTTLQERADLEMSVLRRQEAVLKLQQEYYTLKIRLLKRQIEESTQKD
ncbi:uncharacterized protein LOC106518387 isoform X2 [Austrofundulus limnaeus]|uniref:Uncharacterized protein LOC106518387 isoform X2 n=1 Tax=Austrofundulus limnaeus TaxID=52670 RepID=A0A2I4BBH7_AUSLI|nr:PREDICTED: uncharacterized protein LOC106518387 isoform X2 [Austrofundulus limnaeus]